jgi:hypothetical protein
LKEVKMANNKKTNPRKIPVSLQDVKKARIEGAEFMFTVIVHCLKDKLEVEDEKLLRLGGEIDYFCDSIRKGYVNYADLRQAQEDEGYSVHIKG